MKTAASCLIVLALGAAWAEPWIVQESGTRARLRGISAVDSRVAWASGNRGTCLRTVDGGTTWEAVRVPGSAGLDFRDVHAVDDRTAYLLSIGAGELSRIFQTSDGGMTWHESYRNRDPKGFLDAIAFRDADHGLTLGDPVDGRFVILRTEDGGRSWAPILPAGMPLALPNEGAFAASGTCLVVEGANNAWFATGGAARSRVFRSVDGGQTWTVAETPIAAGKPSAGIFSLAFRDARVGVAVGGDYQRPDEIGDNLALTSDGGQTWTAPAARLGYRSAVVIVPGSSGPTLIAVGPSGSDLSRDGGQTWRDLGMTKLHALAVAGSAGGGWGVGEDGQIYRLHENVFQKKYLDQ